MKLPLQIPRLGALVLLALLGDALASAQTVTTVGLWRMGDDDSGAVASASVNTTLTASVGSNLSFNGTGGTYSSSTFDASSGFAVNLAGTGNYVTGNNLGLGSRSVIEAWVNLSTMTTGWVALVGNGGGQGVGILVIADHNKIYGAEAGVGQFAGTSITTGTWHHVAVVVDETHTGSFYFDGSLVSGDNNTVNTSYASSFSIGGDDSGTGRINGIVDDVRAFTYTGTFSPSMLSYSAVPEPSTYAALFGVAVLVLALWRRRARHMA